MGYGWPGGLRSAAAAELPRHGRDPHVLLRGLARLAREYSGEVDARGETLLPQRTHYLSRQ